MTMSGLIKATFVQDYPAKPIRIIVANPRGRDWVRMGQLFWLTQLGGLVVPRPLEAHRQPLLSIAGRSA